MVNLLLERGAPINARNIAGSTALYAAAERGQEAVVRRLIERGADVNLRGQSGVSPVGAAAYAGRASIVKLLLAHGADPDLISNYGAVAEQLAQGEARDVLVACRERRQLRQVTGLSDDQSVQRRRRL